MIKNKNWSITLIGILMIIGSLILLYAINTFTCIGKNCKNPSFLELWPTYLISIVLISLAICLLMYKNWARITASIGFLIFGSWLIYLSWDYIKTLSTFFDDEIIKLIIGIICLFISYYLMFNKKLKEIFNE